MGKPPLRFITLFKPNGAHPPSWNISGGSEHDFRMSPLMKPFEKHKKDLLILDNMGDFGFSSHANSTRRFLSGNHANKNSASVDQLIADHIGTETVHRSLELTTEGLFTNQIGCSYISYDDKGQPIPRESDPQLIFDRLFRNPLSHPKKRREMSSLLDRVSQDAKALARKAGRAASADALNVFLRQAPSHPVLVWENGTPRVERLRPSDSVEQCLAPLAEAAAHLLAEGDFQLVRVCEHPECTLWFYDRTKSHKRRWCSMAVCGNRHKVAEYRKRQQG
nr:DUF1552 domain-containing protein [Ralstonia sp.]